MFPKFNNLPSSDFDDFILENSLEIFDDRFLIVKQHSSRSNLIMRGYL